MNISVICDNCPKDVTGGGYAITDIQVHVNKRMTKLQKTETVIHEIIEAYNRPWPHEKVDDLTNLIMQVLNKL